MRHAWGKFDRATNSFHPLAHHCMDVAAVFAGLIRLPIARDRLDRAMGCSLMKFNETGCPH